MMIGGEITVDHVAFLLGVALVSIGLTQAALHIRRGLESVMRGPMPGQSAPRTLSDVIHGTEPELDVKERPDPYPRPEGAEPGSNAESEWLWAIDVVTNQGMHTQADILMTG